MKRKIKIGILGASIVNANLGVNALGFCLLNIVEEKIKLLKLEAEYVIFSTDEKKKVVLYTKSIGIKDVTTVLPISLKKIKVLSVFKREVKQCDLILDITGGDSFSDIYGAKRFIRETVGKIIANKYSTVILAPQTIGPFGKKSYEYLAAYAIKHSKAVFARDEISYQYTKKLTSKDDLYLTSDVAFMLPYSQEKVIDSKKFKIGLNISALMWNGGYTQNNQFGLCVDYPMYINSILAKLLEDSNNEIYLIPHVVHTLDVENDYIICKKIKKQYPSCILTGPFETPMDAKSVIKDMDIFIGGRMHSTIASISSGVPVIPISYSRKFEGLFNSINYKYIVNCRELSTEEAIQITFKYINDIDNLKNACVKSSHIAFERLVVFSDYINSTLLDIKTENCKS